MRAASLTLLPLLLLPHIAFGDETLLRLATIAPDGTSWARVVKTWSREVETDTNGAVKIRWAMGGIAGDEHTALERARRGQLDGAAGALQCQELAPSLAVMRVIGVVQSRAEANYLINQMRTTIQDEMRKNGFVTLALGGFGNDVMFLRSPVSSLAEMRKLRIWVWNKDDLGKQQMAAMGFHTVPADVSDVARLYDDDKLDGVFAVPTAALAFQWTSRAHYYVDLRASYLAACLVMTQRSFDQLTFPQQQAIKDASAKLAARFEDVNSRDDYALLNGLFEHQGMVRLKASEALRDEFFQAAVEARSHIDPKTLAPATILRALTTLGDFRAEHP